MPPLLLSYHLLLPVSPRQVLPVHHRVVPLDAFHQVASPSFDQVLRGFIIIYIFIEQLFWDGKIFVIIMLFTEFYYFIIFSVCIIMIIIFYIFCVVTEGRMWLVMVFFLIIKLKTLAFRAVFRDRLERVRMRAEVFCFICFCLSFIQQKIMWYKDIEEWAQRSVKLLKFSPDKNICTCRYQVLFRHQDFIVFWWLCFFEYSLP